MAASTDTASANPLDELFDVWDKDTGDGRDENAARSLAKDYVATNSGDFTDLQNRTVEELVSMVDKCRDGARTFREVGMESEARMLDDQKLKIDVFLLAAVPKRYIGGQVDQDVPVYFPVEPSEA